MKKRHNDTPEQRHRWWLTYYKKNREALRQKAKRRHQQNKELDNARASVYQRAHYQQHVDAVRRYLEKHRDRHNAANRRSRARHPDTGREYRRRWQRSHRELVVLYAERYLARKNSLPDTLTLAEWEEIKVRFGFQCAYCGLGNVSLEQEHVVPVTKGGGTTKTNIVQHVEHVTHVKTTKGGTYQSRGVR